MADSMLRHLRGTLGVLVLAQTLSAQGRALTATDLGAFFDGAIPQQLEREDIAGAVVAVVKDGQVLFAKG